MGRLFIKRLLFLSIWWRTTSLRTSRTLIIVSHRRLNGRRIHINQQAMDVSIPGCRLFEYLSSVLLEWWQRTGPYNPYRTTYQDYGHAKNTATPTYSVVYSQVCFSLLCLSSFLASLDSSILTRMVAVRMHSSHYPIIRRELHRECNRSLHWHRQKHENDQAVFIVFSVIFSFSSLSCQRCLCDLTLHSKLFRMIVGQYLLACVDLERFGRNCELSRRAAFRTQLLDGQEKLFSVDLRWQDED